MPQGAGYFWGGLAQGLQAGANLYVQMEEIKEKKKLRKEAEELKQKLATETQRIANWIDKVYADGRITPEEFTEWVRVFSVAQPETQERFKWFNELLAKGDIERAKEELSVINDTMEYLADAIRSGKIKAKDAIAELENLVRTDAGKATLELILPSAEVRAQDIERERLIEESKLSYPARRAITSAEELRKPYFEEQLKIWNEAINRYSYSPESFERFKKEAEAQGYSIPFTAKEAQKMITEGAKFYDTPEEAWKNTSDIPGFEKVPVQNSKGLWGIRYTPIKAEAEETEAGYSVEDERARSTAEKLADEILEFVGVIDITQATEEQRQRVREEYEKLKPSLEQYPRVLDWLETYLGLKGMDVRPLKHLSDLELKMRIWNATQAGIYDEAGVREAQLRGYLPNLK